VEQKVVSDDVSAPFNWKEHIDDNKKPVIGIVAQPLEDTEKNLPEFAPYKSYIMVAYVDYMKAQGARVIPIINGEDKEVTLDKIHHIDGVFLPGGGADYFDIGKTALDEVLKINDGGQFYPLWGTCQGYEYLTAYTADMGMKAL
jgi:gamma-glutamyl hydrolase|tara:strand:+ start:104 stop:535 length:432 start_codon:yes stop_codon:yes gene_type:complete